MAWRLWRQVHYGIFGYHLFYWKLKKINKQINLGYCSRWKYYSFILMHCSCPMNNARGAEKKNAKCKTLNMDVGSKRSLNELFHQVWARTTKWAIPSSVGWNHVCHTGPLHDQITLKISQWLICAMSIKNE